MYMIADSKHVRARFGQEQYVKARPSHLALC